MAKPLEAYLRDDGMGGLTLCAFTDKNEFVCVPVSLATAAALAAKATAHIRERLHHANASANSFARQEKTAEGDGAKS